MTKLFFCTGLLSFLPLLLLPIECTALPQGPPGVTPSPIVQSLTLSGSGCPTGQAGTVQRAGTDGRPPVFLFPEWNLSLPLPLSESGPVVGGGNPFEDWKGCVEEIKLVRGPVGAQLRIGTVTVGGWASLGTGVTLRVDVATFLGGINAGVSFDYLLTVHTSPNVLPYSHPVVIIHITRNCARREWDVMG